LWWLSARDPGLFGGVQDIEGSESFMYYHSREQGMNRPSWSLSACAKINRSAVSEDKPTVVFTTVIPRPGGDITLPDATMEHLIFQTVSQGAGIWIEGATMVLDSSPATGKLIRKCYDFIEKNEEHFLGARSCAPVAVLYSRQCGDHYAVDPAEESDWTTTREVGGKEGKNIYLSSFHGIGELLLRNQVPFDIILDKDLDAGKLSRYRTLVLENSPCLSDEQCRAIREYVSGGGSLWAAYETSLYDELGRKRDGFGLADVFGVDIDKEAGFQRRAVDWSTGNVTKEEFVKIETSGRIQEKAGWTIYFDRKHPVFSGVRNQGKEGITYFAPYSVVGLKLTPPAKVLGDWRDELKTPAVVANEFGKGRCLYFSGSIGSMFYLRQHAELKRLTGNGIGWLSRGRMPVIVKSPSDTVEVTVSKKGDSFIVHLVNYSFGCDRPVDKVFPVEGLTVVLKDGEMRKKKKAKLLMAGKTLRVKNGVIQIPRLGIYEGIVLT